MIDSVTIGREIAVSDMALFRALLELYKQQTERERQLMMTYVHNNVGFDAVDAPFLSQVCEQLGETGMIPYSWKVKARIKVCKYLKQLEVLYAG